MHEAAEMLPVVGSVTILTNGAELTAELPEGARVDTRKIAEFAGDGVVERVVKPFEIVTVKLFF